MNLFWFCFVILFLGLLPAFLMALWNLTLPELFEFPEITYWQAVRLILISALLFGGFFIQYHIN